MGRPRMSDAEREAKRKARSAFTFSDAAYRHYNPDIEGFGSSDNWETLAEQLFGKVTPQATTDRYLIVLGLNAAPKTLDELKSAMRRAMMTAHPDHGGSNVAAREVLEAFAHLKRKLFKIFS